MCRAHHLAVFLLSAVLLGTGLDGAAADGSKEGEKRRQAEAALREADRARDSMQAAHQHWQYRLENLREHSRPTPLKLDVPVYTNSLHNR